MQKKLPLLSIICFLSAASIYAEKSAEESGRIRVSIKRMISSYEPQSYEVLTKTSVCQYCFSRYGTLEKNEELNFPFSISYFGKNRQYGMEVSYYKLSMNNAHYDIQNLQIPYGSFSQWRSRFPDIERSEIKANFIRNFQIGRGHIGIGLGIRNIKTLRNDSIDTYMYYENLNTYGPQVGVRVNYPLSANIYIAGSLELYWTQGKRVYEYSESDSGYYLWKNSGGSATRGEYYGYEADLNFGYFITKHMSIAFGVSIIKSKFSYLNYKVAALPYEYQMYYDTLAKIYNEELRNDEVRGWYIGVNMDL